MSGPLDYTSLSAAAAQPWTDVTQAVATSIQTAIVLAAAIYAYTQVVEARRSRNASAALYLADRLNDFDAAKRRRILFRDIYPRIASPTREDEIVLGQIANEYHSLGYLVGRGLIDKDMVLALQHAPVIRAWKAMEPWIMKQRVVRGSNYGDYFEELYNLCLQYVARSRPDETINVTE